MKEGTAWSIDIRLEEVTGMHVLSRRGKRGSAGTSVGSVASGA